MCGIAGSVDLVPGLAPAEELVGEMTDLLSHRGPDDAGMLVDGPVVLGHRRLSIIDLSEAGHQPMPARDESLWITFNGELYNYVELREELRALGHEFHTASDTEVLLEAYAAWGTGMLERLNGMFAFAIRDRRRDTLLLVRDRFGVKPMYHTSAGGRFRFASEIKALLVDPEVPRRPNEARVLDFLAYEVSDHTEETMFEGVLQLPPGSYLELRPYARVPDPVRWYRPRPATSLTRPAGRHLRSLLDSAVTLRLRSDVPVGVALSGGMDSSSVLAVASRLRAQEELEPPRTFSARSSDPATDEFRYSEALLRTTGSANDQTLPTADGLMAELDSLVWHMDEPFHSPSVYGQRTVHELARSNGVIVLLDGQGGDEALSGYHHFHYPALLWSLLRRGRLLRFAREVRARRRRLGTSAVRSLKDVTRLLLASRRRSAGRPDWLAVEPPVAPRAAVGTSLPAHQDYGLAVAPLPAYNHHADRNSMTFSLETRNPFLDVRVVEAARAMRSEDLLHDGYTKWALREGVRDIVPPEIVDRAAKQGFTTDEPIWFRERLVDELASTFASESMAGRRWFDVKALQAALEEHRAGGQRASQLWRAYVVERWLRLFVDPAVLVAPTAPASAVPSRGSARDKVVRLSEPADAPTSALRAG
jgi:asparagine synthase (glutamine-hydrolysing)